MDSRIIRASGFWNLALAATLLYPPLYRALGLNLTQPVWGWLIAGFLFYTSVTLILGSRDLRIFGRIILWEGFLRIIAAGLLVPAGCLFDYGAITAFVGLADLVWGVLFFLIVPRMTGMGVRELLIRPRG